MAYYNHGHREIKAVNQLYKGIETPDDLYEALMHCWTRETCTARLRNKYSESNKTAGQCAITAFLVQDIFGGEIRELDTGRGLHCYNVINGIAIDLTSEQFGEDAAKLCYENNPLQPAREIRMAETQKGERYELLKKNLQSYILESCQK
ncbi:MAG: hypothetical protein MJ181_07675 [Treponema sp.]|nr:hypothetical protein [Treponema sp.]